jgi:iron-sulfur cluster insertion protein
MLTVTQSAAQKLRELVKSHAPADCSIRIQVLGAGCSGYYHKMIFDQRDENDDEIMEIDGCQILIDSSSWTHLRSTTLDYEENQSGSGFKFIRSSQNQCEGCGGACK